VQVDPAKPKLKPPGTNPLTLNYDEPHSNVVFSFNMRRYTKGPTDAKFQQPKAKPTKARRSLNVCSWFTMTKCVKALRAS